MKRQDVTAVLSMLPLAGCDSWCMGQPWGGAAIMASARTEGAGEDEEAPILFGSKSHILSVRSDSPQD